ncbi:helix-turn-helix domain-containing protein [Mesorhizobium sp. M1004]|uniref:helix-turn-helix domain-containing protein n=1 Tax=Mesorhizobium sp. M1004 TaxID=2957046 RepID=UPI003334FC99
MLTTGNQLRAARALADLEQRDVAQITGISINTIRNMESSGSNAISGRSENVLNVQRALEEAGVDFLNHGAPGVRMRLVQWRRTTDGQLPPMGTEVLANYMIGKVQTQRATFDRANRTWTFLRTGMVVPENQVFQWAPAPWNYRDSDWLEE